MDPQRLAQLRDSYKLALLDDVVPFWQRHAVDRECGGFFTCLDREGSLYGTDKPVWLQGRAAWLFATLYDRVEPREEWLDLARHGCNFLIRHCFAPVPSGKASASEGQSREASASGKMYFLVTRDGRPLRMRRYAYSEVFGVLAFASLAKATNDGEMRRRAIGLFDSLVDHLRTPGRLEPKVDPHARPMKGLAPLMCLLNVSDTMLQIDESQRYEQVIDECVEEIFRDFVRPDDGCVLETVGPDGEFINEPEGRIMNPGHAIEAAWFIMEIARRRQDPALARRVAPILEWSIERGWDAEHGGLLYFVDVAGKPSPMLEHDMKLWWPHCEALYATLLAHRLLGDWKYVRMHERMHEWTMTHFPDPEHGEWFGYLHRDGSLSSPVKGGYWKGPFHVPRALLYCWKLLEEMTDQSREA